MQGKNRGEEGTTPVTTAVYPGTGKYKCKERNHSDQPTPTGQTAWSDHLWMMINRVKIDDNRRGYCTMFRSEAPKDFGTLQHRC